MADYKDIISGTFSKIANKVKEVADSNAVRDIYEQGTSRAKAYGRITKLTLEMNGQNEELKRIYAEIGKLYFEQAKDAPEGFFAPLFAQAEEISVAIDAKQAEIDELKTVSEASPVDADIEVEFEEVVDATELDGTDCCCSSEEAPEE